MEDRKMRLKMVTRRKEVRKKIKNWLLKKEEGMSDYVSAVIVIFCLLAFFMAMIYAYSGIVAENNVQRVHRKYLLAMEREGYLNDADMASLQAELAALGVTNVNLNGTSRTEVGYGNTVVLRIECDIPVNEIVNMRREGAVRHVIIEKEGTALY